MRPAICGFHLDEAGEWVAELACGHDRHVRHRPPFEERAWVLEAAGRTAHVGTRLECRRCEQDGGGEPPCSANLVCEGCGVLGAHAPGCPRR